MNRDTPPAFSPRPAEPEWLPDGTPYSREFGDVYYSRDDGCAEARHVFLAHNALEPRWRALPDRPGTVFIVNETGFGTGLNFLLAWELWERSAPAPARLVFRSLEAHPLTRTALARANAAWPELGRYSAALAAAWPPTLGGLHTLDFDGGRVRLQLYVGDVHEALDAYGAAAHPELAVAADAWFLDGFAPARNPAMWEPAVLRRVAALSRQGTTLATFTAASAVRTGLADAGFAVERVAGFGRKREMLSARFEGTSGTVAGIDRPTETPWHLGAVARSDATHAVVIGGGIAGACCAHALARRGLRVSVIDAGDAPLRGAPVAPQGILFTQLPASDSAHGEFTLHSYLHALRFYAALFGADSDAYARCGLLQLTDDEPGFSALAARYAAFPELARFVDAPAASAIAGVALARGAIHLPGSGWLVPQEARARLLEHPLIEARFACRAERLERVDDAWRVVLADGGHTHAPVVIVATATAANELLADAPLPIAPLRGQITLIPRALAGATPRCVVCAGGYVAPARGEWLCCGASYVRGAGDYAPTQAEHRGNLERAHEILAHLDPAAIALEALGGGVGYRTSTADRLPIAGPLPDAGAFHRDFAPLRHNARRAIDRTGSYLPGLYVSTGHGSRGLTSAPLCADAIAAAICGEPSPLPRRLQRTVSPARFLIRDIVKGRGA